MSEAVVQPRITPFLWFEREAEEAVSFYISVFPHSRRVSPASSAKEEGRKKTPSTITFELDGQRFIAFNGGPAFHFNEAISFVVLCADQAEIDGYWQKLTEGGSEGRCGWLKDKYGVSWQIVPSQLGTWLQHPAALEAMLSMKKLDIGALEQAAHRGS